MPVYKFKTFEEAERALWNFNPDEAYYARVAELWNFANKLSPVSYPRGIFKFRSLEEANKQREEWELNRAREIQSKRRLKANKG
ncbi:hypothetical protein B1H10_07940 [candidate division KSB1 bacterium 4484_188]|nr:MAG: hypothetical protein B1H10_07940 [candidate division KSB1 bacterium 4484_188]RLB33458.1 MAG: hypothetical protein DRH12_18355 [Deltaproteobacteria bacterium]HFE64893.1 hypothetical protein [Caldithrix sp.]